MSKRIIVLVFALGLALTIACDETSTTSPPAPYVPILETLVLTPALDAGSPIPLDEKDGQLAILYTALVGGTGDIFRLVLEDTDGDQFYDDFPTIDFTPNQGDPSIVVTRPDHDQFTYIGAYEAESDGVTGDTTVITYPGAVYIGGPRHIVYDDYTDRVYYSMGIERVSQIASTQSPRDAFLGHIGEIVNSYDAPIEEISTDAGRAPIWDFWYTKVNRGEFAFTGGFYASVSPLAAGALWVAYADTLFESFDRDGFDAGGQAAAGEDPPGAIEVVEGGLPNDGAPGEILVDDDLDGGFDLEDRQVAAMLATGVTAPDFSDPPFSIAATWTYAWSVQFYDPALDDDEDGLIDEDWSEQIDNDGDGLFSEDMVEPVINQDGDDQTDEDEGGIDNDGDGLIDEDPPNGIDDDGDGLIDEDGPDDDGDGLIDEDSRDDDGDGLIDEDPPNGIDDDGDGLIDEDCASGIDDDGDGLIDEDPINGIDDDGDGLVDEDPGGIDNDGDGLVDEDPIAGIDNDGDGLIDEDPSEQVDNDGDGVLNEDPKEQQIDNDGDFRVDEDGPGDMNGDGAPGVEGEDDIDADGMVDLQDPQVAHSLLRRAQFLADEYDPSLDDDEDGISDEDGNIYKSGIWVVKLMASGLPDETAVPISLTNDGGRQPFFNPAGSDLLYVLNGDIHRLSLDFTADNVTVTANENLTNSFALEAYPAYNATGDRIVYSSSLHGSADIWTMDATGAGAERVTNMPGQELLPRFTLSGRQILYEAWRSPEGDRRVMITVEELP